MFYGSRSFNGDVSKFRTGKVEDYGFIQMFTGCIVFQGNVSEWDTKNAKSFEWMFSNTAFNGDLNKWDTGKVESMIYMFWKNSAWNGNLNKWNTGNVQRTMRMFYSATAFEGNGLSYWNMSSMTEASQFSSMPTGQVFQDTALTNCNKRKIADTWSTGAFEI